MKSPFGKDLLDIRALISHFEGLPTDIQGELIFTLTEQFLDRVKNKNQVKENFIYLGKKFPFAGEFLIQNLLKKAERSGELWYLTTAISLSR